MRTLMLAAAVVAAAVTGAAAQAPGEDQPGAAPPAPARAPRIGPGGPTRSSPDVEVRIYDLGDAAAAIDMKALTSMIWSAVGAQTHAITDTTIAVAATSEQHEPLEKLVASLRERGGAELYRVELVAYEVPPNQVPELGAPVASVDKALVRVLHNLGRGRRAEFEATVRQTYIAEWQPVVADNSVGYQPVVKTVVSGFQAMAIVAGTGDQLDLDVQGRVSKADVKTVEQPLVNGANLTMGLPMMQERSVHARTRVRPGVLTVISVTESLGDAGSLVIAVRVDKAQ